MPATGEIFFHIRIATFNFFMIVLEIILTYSESCIILTYSELWYIQNQKPGHI